MCPSPELRDAQALFQTRAEQDHLDGGLSALLRVIVLFNANQVNPRHGLLRRNDQLDRSRECQYFSYDEAHKLPGLIQSVEAMKALLDSMLVLTKQDRLCHVIHATSDPFYQTWLRQLNVMQHCKIITIGDLLKSRDAYLL
ncbi:hypothetical protein EDB84DRAFT_309784 [Lactarius hengduanensis]|nr:hypothetical protein EDB84DRAFT_309784 [Lactarius hengduanensis]